MPITDIFNDQGGTNNSEIAGAKWTRVEQNGGGIGQLLYESSLIAGPGGQSTSVGSRYTAITSPVSLLDGHIHSQVYVDSQSGAFLFFRYIDASNFIALQIDSSYNLTLVKRLAATNTSVSIGTQSPVSIENSYKLEVIGTEIKVFYATNTKFVGESGVNTRGSWIQVGSTQDTTGAPATEGKCAIGSGRQIPIQSFKPYVYFDRVYIGHQPTTTRVNRHLSRRYVI